MTVVSCFVFVQSIHPTYTTFASVQHCTFLAFHTQKYMAPHATDDSNSDMSNHETPLTNGETPSSKALSVRTTSSISAPQALLHETVILWRSNTYYSKATSRDLSTTDPPFAGSRPVLMSSNMPSQYLFIPILRCAIPAPRSVQSPLSYNSHNY